ncbi:unnamed protein product [Linum trigynum]|uniref:C2H2-type domain-containing protein n=1 Tax=Linum trigynum TaxID=586398 RepID=A0AAV2EMP5_9ROSI
MEITGSNEEVLIIAAAVAPMEELPVAAGQVEVKLAPGAEAGVALKEEAPPPPDKINTNEAPFAAVPISQIAKGKRTKRQRVQSPVDAVSTAPAASANSSVGDEVLEDAAADDDEDYNFDDEDVVDDIENSTSSSILPPSQIPPVAGNTKEEEDMANCLILLARGHSVISNNNITIISSPNAAASNHGGGGGGKFTSRRFMETAPAAGGKAGYYVYECRTCSRTFPSFQALGGHRASHKKPKNTNTTTTSNNNNATTATMLNGRFMTVNMSSDEEDNRINSLRDMNSSLNLQLNSQNHRSGGNYNSTMYGNHHKGSNGSKVHECGICGAEFNSGQALGGHMRRHRAPPVAAAAAASPAAAAAASAAATTTSLSLVTATNGHNNGYGNGNNSRGNNHNCNKNNVGEATAAGKRGRDGSSLSMSLDLDLNLPAPEEKQQLQSAFASKQQHQPPQKKQALVFPSPALVDCHY